MKNQQKKPKLKFNVITLFPNILEPHLGVLPIRKARELGLVEINLVNLRDYAVDNRGTVDDTPYGGGVGMILMVEPIHKALIGIHHGKIVSSAAQRTKIILLSPKGTTYNQKMAEHFSSESEITLICGRYEGVDARVEEYVTDVVSIGNYVLSGGELPALTIMESVVRLLPGVLEKEEALIEESFSNSSGTIEYPQYTRPEEYNNLKVPEVLLSGNHAQIEKWREKNRKIIS